MRHEPTVFKTLDLPGGTLLPFASIPGERVRILCGRVWLTEEGSPRDAFLRSGEEISLDTRGLAVIEALSPARIQWVGAAGVTSTVLNTGRRLMRSITTLWLRQFRRPVAVHAAWL